jgi:hypothetical protein
MFFLCLGLHLPATQIKERQRGDGKKCSRFGCVNLPVEGGTKSNNRKTNIAFFSFSFLLVLSYYF